MITTIFILFILLVVLAAIKDVAGFLIKSKPPTHCKYCGSELSSVEYKEYAYMSPYCDDLRSVYKCTCSYCDKTYDKYIS